MTTTDTDSDVPEPMHKFISDDQQLRAEKSDLERRVLAHERILQALIAHMSETEPKFLDRLVQTFYDPIHVARDEHEHVDTQSYGERFIREVVRLVEQLGTSPLRPAAHPLPRVMPANSALPEVAGYLPAIFRLSYRSGIWEVTKDSHFYGHFRSKEEALETAQTAVALVLAGGGFAVLARRKTNAS